MFPKGVDPEYEGLGVLCVSVTTGRPIADVQVRALTAKEIDAWSTAHPGQSVQDEDPKVVLDSAKESVKTNAYGIAITESGPGRMLVDAKLGVLYAFAWVDRDKVSQVKLVMVEDHDVVFRTRSTDGSVITGVPVVVSDEGCTEIWRGVTQGDDANVHMRHASYLMERDPAPGSFTAYVEGVFPSSEAVELLRGKSVPDKVDLVVPASHPLRVHVKDPQGRPVTKPFLVAVIAGTASPLACEDRSSRTTHDGEASFDRVESKKDAKFTVFLDGGDAFESTSQQVEAGLEEVDVSFVRAFRVARVHVTDPAGKPIERGRVRAWLRLGSLAVPAGSGDWAPEADGALSIPLGRNDPWTWNASHQAEHFSSVVLVQIDPAGDALASVEIPVPDDFTDGERDFGSVRMKELPFLVQGYVVDDRDAAVPGAWVRLRQIPVPGGKYVRFPALDCPAMSDSSGFFKLRGSPPEGDIDLVCEAPDHLMMPLAHVERGDKKVRIVMSRLGTLVSKFLLPAGMPSERVSVKIDSGDQTLTLHLGPNDIVHAAKLAPGKLELSVSVAGIPQPVLSIQEVEVKPGVEVVDPRVVQIDLRQRVFQRTLHVNDPEGKPVSYLTGRVIETSEDRRPPRKITGEDGVIRFITLQASVDVNLGAPGFVTQDLHDVDKDMDVTLERAPR